MLFIYGTFQLNTLHFREKATCQGNPRPLVRRDLFRALESGQEKIKSSSISRGTAFNAKARRTA
jgi:hypothetical protein